ncbi:MAG: hypothetical protein ACI9NN_001517 [Bacteroidia bacterium]|jgi:hypothetical protein
MKKGQCAITAIPIRAEPAHRSEMVNQLLYGETYEVLEETSKDWLKIRGDFDGYEGYMASNQFTQVVFSSKSVSNVYPFQIVDNKMIAFGSFIEEPSNNRTNISLIQCAEQFLNVPYLWGGRSPLGIDCSGFTQVVFKSYEQILPRDASQQATIGIEIPFGTHKEKDLAFFSNKENKVTHVGILSTENRIIHASGMVQYDRFTIAGIEHQETLKLTHKLHSIRRIAQ